MPAVGNRRVFKGIGVLFIMGGLIEPHAAGIELHMLKAVLHENPRRVIGADADGAEGDDFFRPVKLAEPGAKLPQGDVHRTRKRVGQQLRFLAHVQKYGVRGFFDRVPGGEDNLSGEDVFRREARHVDRVLGRGEGRSVGQLQGFEGFDAAAQAHGHGDGVDALVGPLSPDDLGPEDLFAVHGEEQF
ncbi:hypothetical protein SDC9_183289 [bioreactor metagenome]|uniref:Uncharacterized protein n=1 Tax=bioreactor metagenome TaxID=1076179 RepID=A0A645H9U4_9ZZZZ